MRSKMIMLGLTFVVIVGSFTATLLSGDRPALGLDLRGGISIVLFPVKGSDLSTLDTAAEIIRSRVDGLGIAEPEVSRQGDTLVVDLPGVKDRARAEKLVGETAELRFRLVEGALPWSDQPVPSSTSSVPSTTAAVGSTSTTVAPTPSTSGSSSGSTRDSREVGTIAYRPGQFTETTVPTPPTAPTPPTSVPTAVSTCEAGKLVTPRAQATASATVILPDVDRTLCYKLGPTLLTGRNVGEAEAFINPSTAEWAVNVTFRNDDFVTKVAQPYVNKDVAIELDDVVLSAPRINPGITGRDVQISGSFTEREARDLALALRYGALPVQFDSAQQTVQSVSPSLGKDQLRAGIVSGLIGLALVALYMLCFYRLLGMVVWIGLALTGMTFFTVTTWLSATQGLTLTLAGVTGIIVSVGVTVDSYVVYFERLKDEARMGKTIRSSLEPGFRRSFRTIVAADLVSLIGAVVLYLLAAGSVRGFAYFLGLSTVLDLILAYTFMHPLVLLLARRPALVRMRGIGIGAALDIPEARA
ncbi:MAG: protein translocase subunit SecD [Actinomycetota bacterium]